MKSRLNRCAFLMLAAAVPAFAATDTLVILHTNDIHDHIRPGQNGRGGLAYIAGYVSAVRAKRADVLVVDAGDVMEKGDMVAFYTESAIMYEAIGKIGYDLGAPGNHDFEYGAERLIEYAAKADLPLYAMNYFNEEGVQAFPSSTVVDVDGLDVGVIGLTRLEKGARELNVDQVGELVAAECMRLEPRAHLIVVVCHIGSANCRKIAAAAPGVDLFVSGHTHETLGEPLESSDSGALIVQAGSYANYVGRVELEVDLDTEAIVRYEAGLVPMDHATTPCDEAMAAWIEAREEAVCPQADKPIATMREELGFVGVGRLAAAALRERAGVEIGACQPREIVRAGLPKGPIDLNGVFLTGGQRGHEVARTELAGRDIEGYMNYLYASGRGQTQQWIGLRWRTEYDRAKRARVVTTDLDPDRVYSVVMPEAEWDRRLVRYLSESAAAPSGRPLRASFTFTEALADYLAALGKKGVDIVEYAAQLEREQELPEPK